MVTSVREVCTTCPHPATVRFVDTKAQYTKLECRHCEKCAPSCYLAGEKTVERSLITY